MANLDNRPTGYGATVARGAVGAIDEGLRAFMLRVYNYMAIGLVLTGVAAYGVYSAAVSSVPTEYVLRGGVYLTSFGATLYTSQLMWVIVLAPLGSMEMARRLPFSTALCPSRSASWAAYRLSGLTNSLSDRQWPLPTNWPLQPIAQFCPVGGRRQVMTGAVHCQSTQLAAAQPTPC